MNFSSNVVSLLIFIAVVRLVGACLVLLIRVVGSGEKKIEVVLFAFIALHDDFGGWDDWKLEGKRRARILGEWEP